MIRTASITTVLLFLLDTTLLIVCLENTPHVVNRARVPFEVTSGERVVVVSAILDQDASGTIVVGDEIVRWNGQEITLPEVLEFLADLGSIDDEIQVAIRRENILELHAIRLIPFYSTFRFIIITIVVGVITWLIGVFILARGSHTIAGMTLHASLITFAVVVLITLGSISPDHPLSFVARFLFVMSYLTVIPIFFFFTLLYPVKKPGSTFTKGLMAFAPIVILLVPMEFLYMRAIAQSSARDFESFQTLFDLLQASLFVYLAASVVSVAHSLRSVRQEEDRRRLQWVIGGVLVGAVPYLMIHVLPQLISSNYLIPEEFGTMFFLAIPFAFAISFFRYRFLDIELVVNRGLVYIMLSVLVLLIYGMFVLMVTSLVGGSGVFREYIYVAVGTLAIALLFEPIRARVQIIVDETIFPTRVHFRKTLQDISADLHRALSGSELFSKLARAIRDKVPVECIAGYRYHTGVLTREAAHGKESPARILLSPVHSAAFAGATVHVTDESARLEAYRASKELIPMMRGLGYPVALTLRSTNGDLLGVIFLCPRTMRDMFREEEFDLFRSVCGEASDIYERLILQERMILEAEERRRLEELNTLKSDFVSYVSHEFRTPLAAIKMFSELMEKRMPARDPKGKEYLEIIRGETDRLNRMVGNILDSAKIEGKVKQYDFEPLDLGSVAKDSLQIMDYQLRKHGFQIIFSPQRRCPGFEGDREAIILVLTNLIGNAIKYSAQKKYLRVTIKTRDGWVGCEVRDRGVGISQDALPNIFSKYYRDGASFYKTDGVGLGLSLVKHVIDAHRGEISVESERGKGTAFTIWFRAHEDGDMPQRRKKTGGRRSERRDVNNSV